MDAARATQQLLTRVICKTLQDRGLDDVEIGQHLKISPCEWFTYRNHYEIMPWQVINAAIDAYGLRFPIVVEGCAEIHTNGKS